MSRCLWRSVATLYVCLLPCSPALASECAQAAYNCAVLSLKQRDFQSAIRTLTAELERSPRDLKALNLLGIALTEAGQIDKANTRFTHALALDPHFYPARKNLAVNQFNRKHHADAEANFERVLRDKADDEISHAYLAEIGFEKNNCGTALKHYSLAGGLIGQNPPWILHYAECLQKQDNLPQAAAVLNTLPQDDAEDRFQGGMMLGGAGAYPQAAELFASARARYSDPYVAGYNQLLMLTKGQNYAQAIELFNQLVAQGFKRAEVYNLVSEAYLRTGKIQQAYDVLRTATELDPTSEDNYVDLASVCLEYDDYPLGKEILDVGIHYIPRSYRLYVQRGVTFVMRGSLDDAEKDFETASNIAPEKSLPYFALGWVLVQSGQTDKAVSILREKSKLQGVNFLVPYILGVALIHGGATPGTPAAEEAEQAFESSIHMNSEFSHSHSELGKLLYKQGKLDRAISELKTATALDPKDPGPLYVLSQAYRKKGEKAEADELVAQIAKLHTQDDNLIQKMEFQRLVKQEPSSSSPTQSTP
jgi:tetratricopeptide (TPR) repeat protein